MTDRYAVIGNPVAHSLSPRIHALFAEQTGQRLLYERIEAPLNGFADTVDAFFAAGGRGCNVTVPFKGDAADWVSRRSELAEFARAVNTIVPAPDGGYVGHNTDGPGLVADLRRLLGDRDGLRVLLVGAGGAARGVAMPLLESLAGELVIANRTASRAESLARALTVACTRPVTARAFQALEGSFDLVINATSAGLGDQVPALGPALVRDAFCYDMVYAGPVRSGPAPSGTAFCRWSLDAGADAVADGLGMLVEQASLAFELWRGVRPDVEPVLAALREPGLQT